MTKSKNPRKFNLSLAIYTAMRFEIQFFGHKNIRSNHKKTIEITKESHLTPSGDCIIGVNASASCADLPSSLKQKLQSPNSKVLFSIKVGKHEFNVEGRGHENLILTHMEDIVIRKSDFVCPRTLAVKCDKSSDLIPRDMILLLQNPKTKGTLIITVD
jgi:hypothetical protein